MGLSVEETSSVLYDAAKLAQAVRLLTDGQLTSYTVDDTESS